MYFRYFVIISLWKGAGPFIWTILNLLHPRMLCAKFGWHWTSGFGEEVENVKSLQTNGLIRYNYPWIKRLQVSSNKRSRLSSFGDDKEIAKKYFMNVTNSFPSDALRKFASFLGKEDSNLWNDESWPFPKGMIDKK